MIEIARAVGRVEGQLGALIAETREHRSMVKRELNGLNRRLSRLERKRPPQAELITKRILTWALPPATLVLTGSHEIALEVLKAVLGMGR